jgi:hypothetical protein
MHSMKNRVSTSDGERAFFLVRKANTELAGSPVCRYNVPMWIPTGFERRPTTIQSENGPAFGGTELWADDVLISQAIEHVAWDKDPIHLAACTNCLKGDCSDGAWLSIRRAGNYVLFLPSFWPWLEDDSYDQGYDDPPAFLQKGARLLDRSRYLDLRSLVPALPALADLQPLAGWQTVRLLRFEAPLEVLGEASAPVRFERDLLSGTDFRSGDDVAVNRLDQMLEAWMNSYVPIALKRPRWWHNPVTFYLAQGPCSAEWQPLATCSEDQDYLLLAPGYVVDEMPELPGCGSCGPDNAGEGCWGGPPQLPAIVPCERPVGGSIGFLFLQRVDPQLLEGQDQVAVPRKLHAVHSQL